MKPASFPLSLSVLTLIIARLQTSAALSYFLSSSVTWSVNKFYPVLSKQQSCPVTSFHTRLCNANHSVKSLCSIADVTKTHLRDYCTLKHQPVKYATVCPKVLQNHTLLHSHWYIHIVWIDCILLLNITTKPICLDCSAASIENCTWKKKHITKQKRTTVNYHIHDTKKLDCPAGPQRVNYNVQNTITVTCDNT